MFIPVARLQYIHGYDATTLAHCGLLASATHTTHIHMGGSASVTLVSWGVLRLSTLLWPFKSLPKTQQHSRVNLHCLWSRLL